MKKRVKLLSYLLVLAMCMSMLTSPLQVWADEDPVPQTEETSDNITENVDNPVSDENVPEEKPAENAVSDEPQTQGASDSVDNPDASGETEITENETVEEQVQEEPALLGDAPEEDPQSDGTEIPLVLDVVTTATIEVDNGIALFSFTPMTAGFYDLKVSGGDLVVERYNEDGTIAAENTNFGNVTLTSFLDAGVQYYFGAHFWNGTRKGKINVIISESVTSGSFPNGVTWSIDSNGVLSVNGNGEIPECSSGSSYPWYTFMEFIHEIVIQEGITSIPKYAFLNSIAESVSFPDTLTSIGYQAFYECDLLSSIILGSNIQSVEGNAFLGCDSLSSVHINAPNIDFGSEVFYGCKSLVDVLLPEGMEVIPYHMFTDCTSLESIVLPSSVHTIEAYAFSGCTSLEIINLPSSLHTINDGAFKGTKLYQVDFPDDIVIGTEAFWECPIEYLRIPAGANVGANAFSSSSIKVVEIMSPTVSLWDSNKNNYGIQASNLEAVYFHGTGDEWAALGRTLLYDNVIICVETVGTWGENNNRWILDKTGTLIIYGDEEIKRDTGSVWSAYADSINRIIIAGTPSSVNSRAFSGFSDIVIYRNNNTVLNISNITIKEYTKWSVLVDDLWILAEGELEVLGTGPMVNYSNGHSPWYDLRSSITSLTIYSGITSVGKYSFNNLVNLSSVTLPNSITIIDVCGFSGCKSLTSINLPDQLTRIESNAFYENAITSITIPEMVTSIGEGAFRGNYYLESIIIPDNVEFLGSGAFEGCSRLRNVVIGEGIDTIHSDTFKNDGSIETVYLPENLEAIEASAFYSCYPTDVYFAGSSLQWNSLIDSGKIVTTNNGRFFEAQMHFAKSGIDGVCGEQLDWHLDETGVLTISGQGEMHDFTLSENIWDAYKDLITKIIIEDSAESIGQYAFCNFPNLNTVVLGDGLRSIGDYAFYNCNSLATVTFGDGLQTIGTNAFANCSELTEIILPSTVSAIKQYAFTGCSSIDQLTIPEGMITIPEEAFSDCTNLKIVRLPLSVETIDEYAFYGCSAITDVYYSGTYADWDLLLPSVGEGNDPILNARLHAKKWNVAPGIAIGAEGIYEGYQVYIGSADQNTPLWTVAGAGTNGLDGERFLIANEALNDAVAFTDAYSSLANFFDSSFTDKEEVIFTTGSDQEYIYSSEIIETYFPDPSSRAMDKAWWLADSGSTGMGKIVDANGVIVEVPATDTYYARPAFNMQSEGVLFTSAANSGKASGDVSEYCLVPVSVNEEGIWKLTLKDSSYAFTASVNDVNNQLANSFGYSSWPIEIQYSGAKAAENEFVSVMLADEEGNVLYYGHLASGSAEGTQTLMLPTELAVGNYSLHVFAEHINEGNSADLASDFSTINLQVSNPLPVTIQLQPGEGTGDSIDVDGDYLTGDIYAAPECTFTAPEGKTFDAWVANDEAGTVYHVGDEIRLISTELILTAQWKPLPTVVVYSTTTECTGSVADISAPDGPFHPGDQVTLTAPNLNSYGFFFKGWYNVVSVDDAGQVSSFGTEQLANTLVYSFEISDSVSVVAVYEASGTAYVKINVINGAQYRVNEDPTIKTGGTIRVPLGSVLQLHAVDSTKFLHWLNESDKVLPGNSSTSMSVVGSTTITLVYNEPLPGQAYLEFVSDYGQVLLNDQISQYSEIVFPAAPTKIGFVFEGWVLEGQTELVDHQGIIDMIGTQPVITLKPKYTRDETTGVVTSEYRFDGAELLEPASGEGRIGTLYTLTAPEIDGVKFECWQNEKGEIISYVNPCKVVVTGPTSTYIAKYVDVDTEVTPIPTITMMDLFTTADGTNHKIVAVAIRAIPDGYTLATHGVLSAITEYSEDEFVLGAAGTQNSQANATDSAKTDAYVLSVRISKDTIVVYVRGYLQVINEATAGNETYYSTIISGSYNSINNQ